MGYSFCFFNSLLTYVLVVVSYPMIMSILALHNTFVRTSLSKFILGFLFFYTDIRLLNQFVIEEPMSYYHTVNASVFGIVFLPSTLLTSIWVILVLLSSFIIGFLLPLEYIRRLTLWWLTSTPTPSRPSQRSLEHLLY